MKTYPRIVTGVFFLFIVFLAIPSALPAQETAPAPSEPATIFGLGDKMLSINGGLFIPLFFQALDGSLDPSTNLSLGGLGTLRLETFLNQNVTLGGEIGGMFALSPNKRTLLMVPITARIAYYFRDYPFEFPVYFGAGLNISKLGDNLHLEPILKPGVSAYWNYNAEWAFGVNATYWWVPQIYGSELKDESRFGNFLEVTLSALYHF